MTADELGQRPSMARLLTALAAELAASTGARSWTALVGLSSGVEIDVVSVDLGTPPIAVLRERKDRSSVYVTVSDVVHIRMSRREAPELQGVLRGREEVRTP